MRTRTRAVALLFFTVAACAACAACQKSDGSGGNAGPGASTGPAASPATPSPPPPVPAAPSSAPDDPLAVPANAVVVREQVDVPVDGATEKWRLEWTKPPEPDCVDQAQFETCPCAAFAFGEKGYLDLVRSGSGAAEQRLPLSALFEDKYAHLRRWPVTKADSGKRPDLADIAMRPMDTAMKLGDYDHDGRATEFVLVVGSQPCGHTQSVVVGISKTNPALHVFGTAEKPNEPLILEHAADWEKLRAKPAADVVQVSCGDHGADSEASLHVTADGALHAQESSKPCAGKPKP